MAASELIKDIVKPPFANYDVVVYLGCGLFSLPFFVHYLGQHDVHFISYDLGFRPEFVATLVTSLVLLFSVYILGHIIAYAASQLIEKTADVLFGKTSTVILMTSQSGQSKSTPAIRHRIKKGIRATANKEMWFATSFRTLAHLPAVPAYLLLFIFGVFGFYRSRLPSAILEAASTKFGQIGFAQVIISEDTPWFKALEGFVINNFPTATARMYNYLVISGLFRSLSLIFLGALWFETAYLIIRLVGFQSPDGLLMFGHDGVVAQAASFFMVHLVYLFCIFSYLKFQRRYVEEGIFAFVLTKD